MRTFFCWLAVLKLAGLRAGRVPSGPPPGPPPDGPGGGPGVRGDRDDAQPDPNALKQAAVNEILDKLTPAQAATWKRLTGEPFTAQVNLFGPRFGHRGGGRGGPDRGNR